MGDACCAERDVIIRRELVVGRKRETCESGASSQDIDTRGTGSLTKAGASQVHGVLEEVNHMT